MDKFTTHYSNLQIAENASQEVIKGAYRYLQQKWHPDKNPGQRARAKKITAVINRAYEVLSNPEKRREHDEWIARKRKQAETSQWRADLKGRQEEWAREKRQEQSRDYSRSAITRNHATANTALSGLYAHSSESSVQGFVVAWLLCALSPVILSIGVRGMEDAAALMMLLMPIECGALAALLLLDWLITLRPKRQSLDREKIFWFLSFLVAINMAVLVLSSRNGWEWLMLPGVLVWFVSLFWFYSYGRKPKTTEASEVIVNEVSTLGVLWAIGMVIFLCVQVWPTIMGWF